MVNRLIQLNEFDPELGELANWKIGSPLDFAALYFGNADLQTQYRDGSKSAARLAQAQLELELRDKIADGLFVALGILDPHPPGAITPEQISPAVFASPNSRVNLPENSITAFGRKFADVRVLRAQSEMHPALARLVTAIAHDMARADTRAGIYRTTDEVLSASEPNSLAQMKVGRNSTYPLSREVLLALDVAGDNGEFSAEMLHERFQTEFAKRFPRDRANVAPPGLTTFRKQLKRFRQEASESDNNEIAG